MSVFADSLYGSSPPEYVCDERTRSTKRERDGRRRCIRSSITAQSFSALLCSLLSLSP